MVGQAPARDGDGRAALTGRSLDVLLGKHSLRDVARSCHRLNLVPTYPGRVGSGDAFPTALARARAKKLIPHLRGRVVVTWGAQVADLMNPDWRKTGWLICNHSQAFQHYPFPHPSGLNRWWNEARNRLSAQAVATRLVNEAGCKVMLQRRAFYAHSGAA